MTFFFTISILLRFLQSFLVTVFIHCFVWHFIVGTFSVPNTLCLLLHLIFTATLYGRNSSYPSFTDKPLRPREAQELSGGRRCHVWIFLLSHGTLIWYRGKNTGARVKSPGLKPQLHTYWLCSLGQITSCLCVSISWTLKRVMITAVPASQAGMWKVRACDPEVLSIVNCG